MLAFALVKPLVLDRLARPSFPVLGRAPLSFLSSTTIVAGVAYRQQLVIGSPAIVLLLLLGNGGSFYLLLVSLPTRVALPMVLRTWSTVQQLLRRSSRL